MRIDRAVGEHDFPQHFHDPAAVVTVAVAPLPPLLGWIGMPDTTYVQLLPICVMFTVWPATVIDPVRVAPPLLATV